MFPRRSGNARLRARGFRGAASGEPSRGFGGPQAPQWSRARGFDFGEHVNKKTDQDPLAVFEKAIQNSSPLVEVKARRVGGSTYQVPIEVSGFRATNLSLRWIIRYSNQRVGRSMAIKLANEIIDTSNEIGNTIKKKEETHKMAEANKAFAHFRY